VFRVWFGESFYPREEIADELKRLGLADRVVLT
jgi:hypothetical protein